VKNLLKERLFWIGLTVKLAVLPFCGSTFARDLFIPFLDKAVLNVGVNPWTLSPPHYFPYGSALFTFLFVPRWIAHALFGAVALGQTPFSMALITGPLLIADAALLAVMVRLHPKAIRLLLITYWLSPVLFFINYVHVQLDVVPMALCILSLALLIERRIALSALAMALATSSKFHVVIVIPLCLAFIWNGDFREQAVKKILTWSSIWLAVSLAGFLPLLKAQRMGYVTVESPQAMRVFGLQLPFGDNAVFFVGIALVLLVLGRLCLSTRITWRGLIYGSGTLFGLLVFVTNPSPGWYYWVFPFLAMYYSSHFTNQPKIFWVLNAAYLSYFVLVSGYGLMWFHSANSVVLTLMQTALLGVLIDLWIMVVQVEMPVLRRLRPVVIGIAGDSGVGKNTLSVSMQKLFGVANTVLIEGDDYHRWGRDTEKWDFYTHLNPRANQLPMLASHMNELLQGRYIFHPQYDHMTGTFTDPRELRPNKTVIIQGLHTLYLRRMRDGLDLKVFISPDETVRMFWKMKRDVADRGHSAEKMIENEQKRKEDSKRHILPQKEFADWVIEVYPLKPISARDFTEIETLEVGFRHLLWNEGPVYELGQALKELGGCDVTIEHVEEDIDRIALKVAGAPSAEKIGEIGRLLYPNLRQLTRGRKPPAWQAGGYGINQLILLALLQSNVVSVGS
jgi:uridine kinase